MVEIGERVPSVKLVDTDLKLVSLRKLAKKKMSVIAFFPGAFTGVCTKEMCALRDSMERFNSMNAEVYAISVDGPFPNKEFKQKNGLNFAVLSDYKKQAIKKFGIVFDNFAHVKGYKVAKRSVFIADSSGIIRYKWVTDDPTVEPNYSEIEAAVKSPT